MYTWHDALAATVCLMLACGTMPVILPPTAPLRLMPVDSVATIAREVSERINLAFGDTIVVLGGGKGSVMVVERCGSFDGETIQLASCEGDRKSIAVNLVHEIGHVFLGPGHSTDPASIMYSVYSPTTDLDEAVTSLVEELRK